MRACVLDLDGSGAAQPELCGVLKPDVADLRGWGPPLRLGCSWRRFAAFEQALDLPTPRDGLLIFLGSGDFHHLSLAILRRIGEPFNLAVIDAEPDWRRGWGLWHRNWLRHVPMMTQARRIFHLGASRWNLEATQQNLDRQDIVALPLLDCGGVKSGKHAPRQSAPFETLRVNGYQRARRRRLAALLEPHRAELQRRPLYISLDKTALAPRAAEVNGESGCLWFAELADLLRCLIDVSGGQFLAMDIAGDWSPRVVRGVVSRSFNLLERAPWHIDPAHAARLNQQTNLMILAQVFDRRVELPLAA
jgi:hypothetical protein